MAVVFCTAAMVLGPAFVWAMGPAEALDTSPLSPEERFDELERARLRLADAIGHGADAHAPVAAARAKVKLNCWVGILEQDGNSPDRDLCRREFYVAMYFAENGFDPEYEGKGQEAMPAVQGHGRLVEIYFGANSARLGKAALRAIRAAAAYALKHNRSAILVSGHSDALGDDRYNLVMSERRAGAVRKTLIDFGVAEENVIRSAFGDTAPMVPTADGVAEPYNRRVEIDMR
jgi:outer membrane protein OmpA-like peptidoglycan-associated protein